MLHSSVNSSALNASQLSTGGQAELQFRTNSPLFFSTMQVFLFTCIVILSVLVVAQPAMGNTNDETPSENSPLVRFHAWGGSAQVNGYLQWVALQVKTRFNIELQHVKLADTSDAVSRVLAEKAAGNHNNGSVDLIWINGENFAAMKKHGLLSASWVSELNNFSLTNPEENSAMTTDFGEPTLGMEAPWGKRLWCFTIVVNT